MDGNVGRGDRQCTYLDQIADDLIEGQVKSINNERICVKSLMLVEELKEVWEECYTNITRLFSYTKYMIYISIYKCNYAFEVINLNEY